MFVHTDVHGAVEVAFTDRHGGVSHSPYTSLNLGHGGGDDPAAIAENLRRVATEFNDGVVPAQMLQVHGADVAVVGGVGGPPPTADALVTTTVGVALMVRVADCVPILLADADSGVVAAVHSGRAGLVAGVVPAAVQAMRAHGAGLIQAWIGPSICGGCYELPDELREHVCAVVPEAWAETRWGTPAVDVARGVVAQLDALEVRHHSVGGCTWESPDLYSYRRDGVGAGRLAGLIRLRP